MGAAGVLDIFAAWNRALAPHVFVVSAAELSQRVSCRAATIALAQQYRRTQWRFSCWRRSCLPTVHADFVFDDLFAGDSPACRSILQCSLICTGTLPDIL